jgi:hypothetical protein
MPFQKTTPSELACDCRVLLYQRGNLEALLTKPVPSTKEHENDQVDRRYLCVGPRRNMCGSHADRATS